MDLIVKVRDKGNVPCLRGFLLRLWAFQEQKRTGHISSALIHAILPVAEQSSWKSLQVAPKRQL